MQRQRSVEDSNAGEMPKPDRSDPTLTHFDRAVVGHADVWRQRMIEWEEIGSPWGRLANGSVFGGNAPSAPPGGREEAE